MGVIMGPSNVLSALAANEIHFPGIFGSFPDALIPGLNLVEAGQVSTGSILSWFKKNFAQGVEAEAEAQGLSVYQLLDKEAAEVPPGSQGLIVLDYFQGNRTPHTDSFARGAVWGLSLQSTRAHVFRALMEGIAYGMRDILDTFSRHDFHVERIIASGGATHSPLFMQIYADVLGKTLYTTKEAEASLLGSAVVAAVGAGAYPDLVEASRSMVTISGQYDPDPARHDAYDFYARKYQETYPQLRELMRAMSGHVAG
jgi:ribulose kinase